MGTEYMRVSTTEGNDEFPPVPPGFESFASFTLKKVEDGGKLDKDHMASCSASTGASDFQPTHIKSESDISDSAKLARSQRHRPLVNYGRYDDSSEDENDSARLNQIFSVRPSLPKGVIRGCRECIRCQKVTARWRPGESHRPDLADAPAFYPTEEEFEDPLKYIARIRPKAELFGICRIVPPSSWKVPCPLTEKSKWESSYFSTRVQRVDKLQNRGSMKRIHRSSSHTGKKRRRCARMGVDYGTGETETFGFEPGPEFTLDQFQKYADDFKVQYFGMNENIPNNESSLTNPQKDLELSLQDIEGEYWRMVEKPTEEIEVLYGADLETGAFGSGFPKLPHQDDSSSHDKYTKSGWNLNNFPRLPGSVLSYEESDISGVLVPWLYIGMCFSSFCWHVEDHHLYSLNYMHWGAPKMWYGIPAKNAPNFEEAMRKHLPDLFEEQPDLLHKLVTQLSPSVLKSEGVPVFRCVQNPGEFVLTFPRAYHSGFNCGFNCAEAVNVAPVDWLPHGQIAVELYRDQGRRTSISHDKLLLGAAREAVKAHWEINLLKKNTCENLRWTDICGKDGVLAKALRARVEMERVRREYLCNSSRTLKMESSFDATGERECFICLFDLHLSAAGCHCSPDKYACLNHAKQLCSCNSNTKFFLFRYEISELNILVEALEGKLSAIYRWARLDLGLALSSHISRDSLSLLGHNEKAPHLFNSTELKQEDPPKSAIILDCTQRKGVSRDTTLNSNGLPSGRSSQQAKKSLENSKDTKASFATDSFITKITALKMPSVADNDNVILLSDDENDEPEKLCPNGQIKTSVEHSIVSEKLKNCDNKAVSFSCDKNSLLATSLADPGVKCQGDAISSLSLFPGRQNDDSPIRSMNKKEDHNEISELSSDLLPSNVSCSAGCTNTKFEKNVQDLSSVRKPLDCSVANVGNSLQHHLRHVKEERNENSLPSADLRPSDSFCLVGSGNVESSKNGQSVSSARDPGDCPSSNARSSLRHPQPYGKGKHSIMDKHELMGRDATSNSVDIGRTVTESQSCSQNHVDKYFRHKGPRIARIVRKSNLNVVPVDYGVVISGKLWCSSQAIFPKGFRSRVRYISVLDPTNVCYYVSEILDTGRGRPLFMVSLEDSPNEVFVHVTATRCWDMVRERVNQEIARRHKLGKANLPPLQPPGSLNGLEMFGFLSPAITRAVEAMDQNHVCAEYWDSRLVSRSQVPVPLPKVNGGNAQEIVGVQKDNMTTGNELPVAVDTVLKGLFKKASLEELRSLYSILGDSSSTADRCLVTRLLHEELQNLPK